jgi:DNA (cytosine-5)-methyltransferase 1
VRDALDLTLAGGPVYKPGRAANTISRHEHGKRNVGDRFYICPFYGRGSGKTGRSIDRPCGTLTCKARWSLHDGELDTMRMLTTEETLKIAGFPVDYFDGLDVTWTNANIYLGNAVTPAMAQHILAQLN